MVAHSEEPFRIAVNDRTVDLGQRNRERFRTGPYRLDGREADMCHLRKGISCPRDHESTDAAAQRKQRILDSDARHRIGSVSEVEPRADVTCSVDPPVRCSKPVVYLDA